MAQTARTPQTAIGTRDGAGAADHDSAFEFGRHPCADMPFPFSIREYTRLLILRARIGAGACCTEDDGRIQLPLRRPAAIKRGASPWCRCVDCGAPAPLPPQLGSPMRCSTCERTQVEADIADAILYTAGVEA